FFAASAESYYSSDSDSSMSSSELSVPPSLYPSFAPPFYNRPPTPLPPSPSLTSLLRPPPFTPSRPTTSDESDAEAAASSFAKGTPRAAPTYEYHGFVLYLGGGAGFGEWPP